MISRSRAFSFLVPPRRVAGYQRTGSDAVASHRNPHLLMFKDQQWPNDESTIGGNDIPAVATTTTAKSSANTRSDSERPATGSSYAKARAHARADAESVAYNMGLMSES